MDNVINYPLEFVDILPKIQVDDKSNKEIKKISPNFQEKINTVDKFRKMTTRILENASPDSDLYKYAESYARGSLLKRKIIENIILNKPLPKPIIGWRFGDIPEGGKSFNTREEILEPGVSMMQTSGGKKNRGFAGLAHRKEETPIYVMVGYLNDEKGSDGEDLLINPINIKVIKKL